MLPFMLISSTKQQLSSLSTEDISYPMLLTFIKCFYFLVLCWSVELQQVIYQCFAPTLGPLIIIINATVAVISFQESARHVNPEAEPTLLCRLLTMRAFSRGKSLLEARRSVLSVFLKKFELSPSDSLNSRFYFLGLDLEEEQRGLLGIFWMIFETHFLAFLSSLSGKSNCSCFEVVIYR